MLEMTKLSSFFLLFRCSAVSNSLQPHGREPTRLLCPWGFSRQVYWNRLPFPSPGNLTDPGIELRSPTLQADSLLLEPPGKPHFFHLLHEMMILSQQLPCSYILAILMPPTSSSLFYFTIQDLQLYVNFFCRCTFYLENFDMFAWLWQK